MDNPLGNLPQLPPGMQDKINQIDQLLNDLQRGLAGFQQDPVDDQIQLPWEKPANKIDLRDVLDYLQGREDPTYRFRPRPGVRISGIEMTQSTQYYDLNDQGSKAGSDNFIPLVEGKDLILRVYVERRSGFNIIGIPRFDGIVRYNGKEVRSLNGPLHTQEASALLRRVANDSLNFRIPGRDCRGKTTFNVEVFDSANPKGYIRQTRASITAQFFDVPRMRITGVLFSFTGNNQNLPAPTGIDLVNTLARFLPMFPIQGFDYNVCTLDTWDQDMTVQAGWDNLLNRLANLRSASTARTFFVGLLPAAINSAISAAARGIGQQGLAIAANDDTRALSHELGHGCGFAHVNENSPPGPFDTKYPTYGSFPFGSIGEVGMDTARQVLYNPNSSFDFMTYHENGNPPPLFPTNTWISPYNYMRMMHFLNNTNGTADILLSITATVVAATNFRVHRDGRVEVLHSYPLSGVPHTRDSRPEANLMLDLYDRDERLIGSYRCHQHNPYQDPDGAYLDFHEVLPWPENLAEIVVVRERQELARLRVNRDAPEVQLDGLTRLEREEGGGDLARIEWSVSGGAVDAGQPAALVRYSHDGGHSWQAVAADVRETRFLLNLDLLPGGDDCRLQVIVSNGLAAKNIESEPFRVRQKPRQVIIVSPKNGETFQEGDPIVFAGAGHSPDFGTTHPDEGLWSDSQEGALGSGAYFVRSDLRPGKHRITLSTPDGHNDDGGSETSASVWIKVVEKAC